MVEELCVGVAAAEALEKITAVWAPREDGSPTAIAPPFGDQRPVEFKEESYRFKSSNNTFNITKMMPYLVLKILHLIHVINLWFLPY
jgi:hypothetical protein